VPTPYVPQTVTITDYFEDGAGHPLDGRVEFRPSVTSKTPGGTITRAPIVAKITGGNLSVVLVAPDSTGVTPQNWTYEVRLTVGPPGSSGAEGIDAFTVETWNIRPAAANPAVVLRDLTEVDPVPASAFAVRSVAGVLPDIGGNIALTAEDLEANGIGFVAESTFNTFKNSKAQPSGLASLDSGGLIPVAQLPPIALSDYLGTTASQAAMLALTGQRGDWTIRTDTSPSSTWVLNAEPSSTLANWTQLPQPAVPVSSVAGKTGAVTLVKGDVGLGNVDNTADSAKPLSSAATTALAGKAATVHTHTVADVTSLQGILDDNTAGSTDLANLGDLFSSTPRNTATSQDTLSNQFLTIYGGVSLRSSFVATKLRLHVRTAIGSPGIMTLALFKGTNRLALAKVVADSVVTTAFGTTGPKEFSFTGVTINRGDFVYLALLHTNAGTDPVISTLPEQPGDQRARHPVRVVLVLVVPRPLSAHRAQPEHRAAGAVEVHQRRHGVLQLPGAAQPGGGEGERDPRGRQPGAVADGGVEVADRPVVEVDVPPAVAAEGQPALIRATDGPADAGDRRRQRRLAARRQRQELVIDGRHDGFPP
jgi:hypothetical protein